jgi:uncharacterized protein (TIRG00374 family)
MRRAVIAVVLTAALVYISHPREIWAAVTQADPWLLALAFGLVLVDRAVMAHRWYELLGPAFSGRRPPFLDVLHVSFVSSYLGTLLPTSVGGEALRVVAFARRGFDGARVLATVLMDRVLGVISMLLIAIIGTGLAPHLLRDPVIATPLALVFAGSLLTAALLYSRRAVALAWTLLRRLTPRRLLPQARRFLLAIHRHAADHRTVTWVLAESMLVQLLRITQAYLVGTAIGLHLPYTAYLALIPLALLVLLLPVSIGGMGTGQASFMLLFGRVGVSGADAFTLATLLLLLSLLGNLPGGLAYALGREIREPGAPAR